jgi:hypothetical protein
LGLLGIVWKKPLNVIKNTLGKYSNQMSIIALLHENLSTLMIGFRLLSVHNLDFMNTFGKYLKPDVMKELIFKKTNQR